MGLDREWPGATEAEALVVGAIKRVKRDSIALEEDIYGQRARSLASIAERAQAAGRYALPSTASMH
jgi:hypothetical protein